MSVSTEWGLFNDEGLIEGDFWSFEEAAKALLSYDVDDDLHVATVCQSCREWYADGCDCDYDSDTFTSAR